MCRFAEDMSKQTQCRYGRTMEHHSRIITALESSVNDLRTMNSNRFAVFAAALLRTVYVNVM